MDGSERERTQETHRDALRRHRTTQEFPQGLVPPFVRGRMAPPVDFSQSVGQAPVSFVNQSIL